MNNRLKSKSILSNLLKQQIRSSTNASSLFSLNNISLNSRVTLSSIGPISRSYSSIADELFESLNSDNTTKKASSQTQKKAQSLFSFDDLENSDQSLPEPSNVESIQNVKLANISQLKKLKQKYDSVTSFNSFSLDQLSKDIKIYMRGTNYEEGQHKSEKSLIETIFPEESNRNQFVYQFLSKLNPNINKNQYTPLFKLSNQTKEVQTQSNIDEFLNQFKVVLRNSVLLNEAILKSKETVSEERQSKQPKEEKLMNFASLDSPLNYLLKKHFEVLQKYEQYASEHIPFVLESIDIVKIRNEAESISNETIDNIKKDLEGLGSQDLSENQKSESVSSDDTSIKEVDLKEWENKSDFEYVLKDLFFSMNETERSEFRDGLVDRLYTIVPHVLENKKDTYMNDILALKEELLDCSIEEQKHALFMNFLEKYEGVIESISNSEDISATVVMNDRGFANRNSSYYITLDSIKDVERNESGEYYNKVLLGEDMRKSISNNEKHRLEKIDTKDAYREQNSKIYERAKLMELLPEESNDTMKYLEKKAEAFQWFLDNIIRKGHINPFQNHKTTLHVRSMIEDIFLHKRMLSELERQESEGKEKKSIEIKQFLEMSEINKNIEDAQIALQRYRVKKFIEKRDMNDLLKEFFESEQELENTDWKVKDETYEDIFAQFDFGDKEIGLDAESEMFGSGDGFVSPSTEKKETPKGTSSITNTDMNIVSNLFDEISNETTQPTPLEEKQPQIANNKKLSAKEAELNFEITEEDQKYLDMKNGFSNEYIKSLVAIDPIARHVPSSVLKEGMTKKEKLEVMKNEELRMAKQAKQRLFDMSITQNNDVIKNIAKEIDEAYVEKERELAHLHAATYSSKEDKYGLFFLKNQKDYLERRQIENNSLYKYDYTKKLMSNLSVDTDSIKDIYKDGNNVYENIKKYIETMEGMLFNTMEQMRKWHCILLDNKTIERMVEVLQTSENVSNVQMSHSVEVLKNSIEDYRIRHAHMKINSNYPIYANHIYDTWSPITIPYYDTKSKQWKFKKNEYHQPYSPLQSLPRNGVENEIYHNY